MADSDTICFNPATGEEIGRSALNTPEEVRRAADRAPAGPAAVGGPGG